MRDGIVITGMGVVTPVGIGVDTYWENLTAGVCGIGEITQIDTTALPIHRAAEVHGFHPKDFMPTRRQSRRSRRAACRVRPASAS